MYTQLDWIIWMDLLERDLIKFRLALKTPVI